MGTDDAHEFGIEKALYETLTLDPELVSEVASSNTTGKVLTAYVLQITGFKGSPASVERSFGGDLVHALYLPHVDLWRGDRRFSAVVKDAVPHYAGRIVPTLKQLPEAIDAWHAADAA